MSLFGRAASRRWSGRPKEAQSRTRMPQRQKQPGSNVARAAEADQDKDRRRRKRGQAEGVQPFDRRRLQESSNNRARLSATKPCSAEAAMAAAWVTAPVLHAGRRRSSFRANLGAAISAPTRAPGIEVILSSASERARRCRAD